MKHHIRPALKYLLDILFPPRCLHCLSSVQEQGALCHQCWKGIHFISPPFCKICAQPFMYEVGEEAICGNCSANRPPYARARAVFEYDEHSRNLVLQLKYNDQSWGITTFAEWLHRSGRELLTEAEILCPVPLYRSRLWMRRYNQAALLANALGKRAGVRVMPELLQRIRPTLPQAGLTRLQRQKNVHGAFRCNARYQKAVQGKRVVLIDDVMTTGATIYACTRALLKAGAARVDVLTMARTVVE